MCIVGVVVTNETNMASFFPEAGNFNASNADMCSGVAGPSSSGSGDLFDFGSSSRSSSLLLLPLVAPPSVAAILDLSVTTTPLLPFWALFVIMHKV